MPPDPTDAVLDEIAATGLVKGPLGAVKYLIKALRSCQQQTKAARQFVIAMRESDVETTEKRLDELIAALDKRTDDVRKD